MSFLIQTVRSASGQGMTDEKLQAINSAAAIGLCAIGLRGPVAHQVSLACVGKQGLIHLKGRRITPRPNQTHQPKYCNLAMRCENLDVGPTLLQASCKQSASCKPVHVVPILAKSSGMFLGIALGSWNFMRSTTILSVWVVAVLLASGRRIMQGAPGGQPCLQTRVRWRFTRVPQQIDTRK